MLTNNYTGYQIESMSCYDLSDPDNQCSSCNQGLNYSVIVVNDTSCYLVWLIVRLKYPNLILASRALFLRSFFFIKSLRL